MPGTLVFPRGSHVLEYWLAHAEGFTVRSRGPVERVIVEPLYGRATALVVRTGVLRRREVVSAAAVTTVDPEARVLELEEEPAPPRQPARAMRAGTWLAPRLRKALQETWAAALMLVAAAAGAGRTLFERGVSWYAERRAPYRYDRRPPPRARSASAVRARRPRGAVGRHLRP